MSRVYRTFWLLLSSWSAGWRMRNRLRCPHRGWIALVPLWGERQLQATHTSPSDLGWDGPSNKGEEEIKKKGGRKDEKVWQKKQRSRNEMKWNQIKSNEIKSDRISALIRYSKTQTSRGKTKQNKHILHTTRDRTVRTKAPPNSTSPYCAATVNRRIPTNIGFWTSPLNTFKSFPMFLKSKLKLKLKLKLMMIISMLIQ